MAFPSVASLLSSSKPSPTTLTSAAIHAANGEKMELMHTTGGSAVLIAGAWFAVGYVIGIFAARKLGSITLWPSIIIGLASCIVRGFSSPLDFTAVAAVTVLHVAIGCLTVLILNSSAKAVRSE